MASPTEEQVKQALAKLMEPELKRSLVEPGIVPDVYLNLETDLHLTKQGPFSSLAFTDDEVKQVADAIIAAGEQKFYWSRISNKKSKFHERS